MKLLTSSHRQSSTSSGGRARCTSSSVHGVTSPVVECVSTVPAVYGFPTPGRSTAAPASTSLPLPPHSLLFAFYVCMIASGCFRSRCAPWTLAPCSSRGAVVPAWRRRLHTTPQSLLRIPTWMYVFSCTPAHKPTVSSDSCLACLPSKPSSSFQACLLAAVVAVHDWMTWFGAHVLTCSSLSVGFPAWSRVRAWEVRSRSNDGAACSRDSRWQIESAMFYGLKIPLPIFQAQCNHVCMDLRCSDGGGR